MTALYEIGPFRLDARAHVLTHAGVPVALGSRAVAVLAALVERPNEHVAKATSWMRHGRTLSSRKAISPSRSPPSGVCSRRRPAASDGWRRWPGAAIVSWAR